MLWRDRLRPTSIETMLIVLVALALWSLSGLVVAVWLRRQGHNLAAHATLGLGFGPLVALFHLESRRNVEQVVSVVDVGGPPDPDGWVDVLVGLDGSTGSIDSARGALTMLGGCIRRLRLATVLDVETANRRDAFDTDDRLVAYLHGAAEALRAPSAELVLLTGRADSALVDHAISEKMDLLVVAHRQHPGEALLMGSTVARLARSAELPVLIGPPVE